MRLDKGVGFEAYCFVMSVIFHTVFHTVHNISRCCCYSIYISVSWAMSELTVFPLEFTISCIFLQSRFFHTVEDIFRVNTFRVFRSDLLRILDKVPRESRETMWTFSAIPSVFEWAAVWIYVFFLFCFIARCPLHWQKNVLDYFFCIFRF